jgi:3'-phosphoadenosine 5'-phosphosulfate sulfotransferase (PAPS reductase)/FAD synthetase
MKCEAVFSTHKKAYASVSGGADSDVMVDLLERVRNVTDCDIDYVWFDTGMEYRATREHLDWLEARYGIEIGRVRSAKTIPVCCREFGQPFMSKMVSQHMGKLQQSGFKWEDGTLEELSERYPDVPTSTLKWWCDMYRTESGAYSPYCIGRNRWLKEFVIENPPTFPISADCCKWAKKETKHRLLSEGKWDVELAGVRKAEGGVRSTHDRCFMQRSGADTYFPLFWLTNDDKAWYVRRFGIRHSDCYRIWGFARTGCVGCPFNRNVFADIDVVGIHEPNMAKAARKVFADSYEYTRRYREFCSRKRAGGQMSLF